MQLHRLTNTTIKTINQHHHHRTYHSCSYVSSFSSYRICSSINRPSFPRSLPSQLIHRTQQFQWNIELQVCLLSTKSSSSTTNASSASSSSSPPTDTVKLDTTTTILAPILDPPRTRWQRIVHLVKKEAKHYWLGTKLLWADTRIAFRLTVSVLQGHELTRRERKQLLRTSADLLRLVPFAVIVIIPFMEFALPLILKLFPNMLPSTYIDKSGEQAKLQKKLTAKIEMAQFLQETTALMAAQLLERRKNSKDKGDNNTMEEQRLTAESFKKFMDKIRSGQSVTNDEILRFSSLFDDEFTMENLKRPQLVAMCKLLEIRAFGSDWVLRYKIMKKLREIKEDDRAIYKEGVNSLTLSELQEACRQRGIYPGQTLVYMRRKLSDWLELSLKHDVPNSLLVLSRAFSSHYTAFDSNNVLSDLSSTLRQMPEVVIQETGKTLVDRSADVQEKLELLKQEEIEKEEKERKEKLKLTQPLALDDIKEKLKDFAEDSDEIEDDIDQLEIEQKRKDAAKKEKQQRLQQKQQENKSPTSVDNVATDITPATPMEEKAPIPLEEPVTDVSHGDHEEFDERTMKKVDKLNERVGKLLDNLQEEIAKADSEQQQQQNENVRTSSSKGKAQQ